MIKKMVFIRWIVGFGVILFFLGTQSILAQSSYQQAYAQAMEALEQGNEKLYLDQLVKADSLRPNHRVIMYQLAVAYSVNQQPDKALSVLDKRADYYAELDFTEEDGLKAVKAHPGYEVLVSKIKELNKEIESSRLAFQIDKPGLHPEGLAYDPATQRFLVSDVGCGEIYSIGVNGMELKLEIDLKDWGYWGAMGMALDTSENILWVASSALPIFCEYTEELEGRSAILKIDLQSGELIQAYSMEGRHVFGDLVLRDNGELLVTDSMDPIIYRIKAGEGMQEYLKDDRFWNLQGLAIDKEYLYVSDYLTGLYAVELNTRTVIAVSDDNQRLRGADGVYAYGGEVFLMQNGTFPFRLSSVQMNGEGMVLDNTYKVWDQATQNLGEPTLGAWKEDRLYFIANSPWAFYDEENKPKLTEWPLLQIRYIER